MATIEVDGVTKRFGDVVALRDLSLSVREGEVYGFLGPNGAGKSTTINAILDFVRPDRGSVQVFGMGAREHGTQVRQRTGVLPEGYDVYPRLTGRQHLEFVADSKNVAVDPDELLDRVGIPDAVDRKAGGYSKGMAQRLLLALALVGKPDLLVLDEPTTGLDPNGARQLRGIVEAENERGATVFFSSHVLSQVEAVADRVGIVQDGELVAEDTLEGLRDSLVGASSLRIELDHTDSSVRAAVEAVAGVSSVAVEGATLSVTCEDGAKYPALEAAAGAGATIQDFETSDASLEDLFADVTGGGRDLEEGVA